MTRQLPLVLLLSPLLLFPAGSRAGDIAEAVQAALQRHPEYGVSQSRQIVAERVAEHTGSLLAGDTAVTLRNKSDALGSDYGLREWGAGLEMPLWLPGQRDSYRQLAEGLGAEATASGHLLAWQVAGEVRELAWSLRLARSSRDLAKTQLESAQALESEVKRRLEAGELANTDWVLARQETLTREAMLQEAQSQVDTAANAWRVYTGLQGLPEPLEEQPQTNTQFPADHPRMQSATSKVERYRAERERVRIERRENPLLSLSANHERSDFRADYDNSLELIIAVPLGSRTQAAPRLAGANADLTEAEAAQALVRRELEQGREQAQLALQQTADAATLAQERNSLAAKGEHLAKRAFELGESDLVMLLRARNQAADAALELERRRLEHQRAIARYNQILGVMPK